MKFKIETAKMSHILSKVAKGVGKKYTLPITECLLISLDSGELLIRSTNGVNFVSYVMSGIVGESGQCVVKADQLIKLVEKTTKPEISFNLKDTFLEVKGNGTYKIQLVVEAFPTYSFDSEAPTIEVNTEVLKRIFKVNESSIAKDLIMPCLTGYNVGDSVITTDGIKMCINAQKVIDERVLITQALADLISATMTAEKISFQKDGNKILITSDTVTIFGTELDGLQDYPDITSVLDIPYESAVEIHKQELLSVLDRLSLFVDEFDNNGVRIKLTPDNIQISDLKGNSEETIDYIEIPEKLDFEVKLNIEYLRDVLSAVSGDIVAFQYGDDLPVKFEDDHVTLFLGIIGG